MIRKQAVAAVMLLLVLSTATIGWLAGCAKDSNPVIPQSIGLSRHATIRTAGTALDIFIHSDTAYIADNQAGIARIALNGEPRLVTPNIPAPTEVSVGVLWVSWDTLNDRMVMADRRASTNLFANQLYYYSNTNSRFLSWLGLVNSNNPEIFHDPDTTMRIIRCHLTDPTNGYSIISPFLEEDTIAHEWHWSFTSTGEYLPLVSKVRHSLWLKPYAFCASEEYGLAVVNYSSYDANPVEVGHVDLPGFANYLAKRDSMIYVSLEYGRVAAVSVSDPLHPQLLSVVALSKSTKLNQVAISTNGKLLFALDEFDGVYVLSLNNPAQPAELGVLPSERPSRMLVAGNQLIVADTYEGVIFYR